tara:strand:+ start:19 stop:1026 length:1008 start_codon:yes stop_codon:yes gene_type:complete
MKSKESVTIFGGGSWGTAIAKVLAENSCHVNLWIRESSVVDSIIRTRENKLFLPGIKLPELIHPKNDLQEDFFNTKFLIFSFPTQYIRGFLKKIRNQINKDTILINTSKGIEQKTMSCIYEIFNDTIPNVKNRYLTMSGPSFAQDVAKKLPTAVSIASFNHSVLLKAKSLFDNNYFKTYTSKDVIGVEIGGSIKNVIAIGAGIIDGSGHSESTKAAFITRGLYEIRILAELLGAKKTTFLGLSGVGDLMLTAYGNQSRNRNLGFMLGKGMKLEKILSSTQMVAEGYFTSKAVHKLLRKFKVSSPILESIYGILYKNQDPKNLLDILLKKDVITDI